MKLKDKIVAITGAGQGIGRALALAFAERGAHVALLDINEESLKATREACAVLGVRAEAIQTNVAVEDAVEAAFDEVVARFGRLDGLVNNAGITRDALLVKVRNGEVVDRMSAAQWQAVIDVNLTGVFFCARAAAERMVRLRNGGVIVNISSIARDGNIGQTNYSAAKAGVVAMAATWGKELAQHGIRTGAIAPGFTATDILASVKPETLDKLVAPVPLKRLADPAEIAHAVLFVFENDYFTGRCIEVDGGLSF